MTNPKKLIETTASEILCSLAKTFPVACSSDEFYYFPHIIRDRMPALTWDDFSNDSVQRTIKKIDKTISVLENVEVAEKDTDLQTDRNVLIHFLTTLKDYLYEHRIWKRQPSFYLTLLNIGLVQVIHSEDRHIIQQKVNMLPGFIEQAAQNLEDIPDPWLETGLSMITDCKDLITSMPGKISGKDRSLEALDYLESSMEGAIPAMGYYMRDELQKKLYNLHLATGQELSDISGIIKDEISEMWEVMVDMAAQVLNEPVRLSRNPGLLIQRVYQELTTHGQSQDDILLLFEDEINKISNHLVDIGILTEEMKEMCPVFVRKMPDYIRAIRSASSYSIDPQHPPQKGTFFILDHASPGKTVDKVTEYRMLTAHETYPGHHLLDSSRLSLKNIIRRSLEFPVFYEGWACLAEMLLETTGYFSGPADRFILAKRRFWRAVRGQVDIGLQTGALNFEEAANILRDAGIRQTRALQTVKIYTLNPGYQVCYTVGIRRFLDLYNRYGRGDTVHYMRTILEGGEILFGDLERRLEINSLRGNA